MKSQSLEHVGLGVAFIIALAIAVVGLNRSYAVSDDSGDDNREAVKVQFYGEDGELSDPVVIEPLELTEDEWRERLKPIQYEVLREHGTERAGTGEYAYTKDDGVYVCAGCELPLFASETKYESGTGWPSFYDVLAKPNVREKQDLSFGMSRTEVLCNRCNGHLGHVFPDGPQPT